MAKLTADYNLSVTNPELSAEWHPTKNKHLKPLHVTKGSNKKVWWICNKSHEWEAMVKSRVRGSGCHFCCSYRVGNDNNLSVIHPDIAKQWHPGKNGVLSPDKVLPHSNKTVWWLCKKGHEYKKPVYTKTRGEGCPKCNVQTSKVEIRIYTELEKLFSNVQWRSKVGGKECNIFTPDIRLGIEVDGYYWHEGKEKKRCGKKSALSKKRDNGLSTSRK